MNTHTLGKTLSCLICLCLLAPSLGRSLREPQDKIERGPVIETLNVKELSMRQFARLLSQGTNWKIVVSQGAAQVPVSIYLEDVHTDDALKAICQSHNLWYKQDPDNGIISIITLEEYQMGMRLYANETVKVVTLRYPDARAIGDAIQRLFQDRVVWHRPIEDEYESLEEVELALERMDALADRAQFSLDGSDSNTNNSSYNSRSSSSSSRNSRSSRYSSRSGSSGSSRYGTSSSSMSSTPQENKVIEDIQRDVAPEPLLERLTQAPEAAMTGRIDQPGVVYVSVFRGTNDLLLRSNDPESVEEVIEVIKQLDKPKPQVLLEVKVLDITLDEEDVRGIDWLFQAGDVSGGRSTGINSSELGTGFGQISNPSASLVPLGSGLDSRAAVLQVVTDDVLARIQMLEDRNRVTCLATPTLCVADNEASRVFVGTETTILKSVEIEQVTTTGDDPVTTQSVDPETDRQNIGTTLLITPRIHADRTATIRIVQEDSQLGNLQTINYSDSASFQSQDVETRSVVTTVVAADGKISAIGGLIRQEEGKREVGVPGLMDMPLVGPLFKTQFKSRQRHELLVLIRPFVLLAPGEAEPISRTLAERLSTHPEALSDFPPSPPSTQESTKTKTIAPTQRQALERLSQQATIFSTQE